MTTWMGSGLRLGAVTAVMLAVVGVTHLATRGDIEAAEAARERERLLEVLPSGPWDGPVEDDWLAINDEPLLGPGGPHRVYRARRSGQLRALAVQATAPNGYNGAIRLLVGVTLEGRISGVRVLSHRETPGLGDPIDIAVSDWIRGFEARSLGDPASTGWEVEPDGGVFDAFTGATITPRAVVRAVRDVLRWQEQLDPASLEPAADRGDQSAE